MQLKKDNPILIIGAGSIGERHLSNLQKLGYHNLLVFRSRNLPFRNIAPESVQVMTDWQAVVERSPKLAFICTPTSLHSEQAVQCAELGMHLFIEKPISHHLGDREKLLEIVGRKGLFCMIGYMMHYHPLVKRIKQIIEEQTFGPLISFSSHWGEYLPDWHPWEDYREGYAARKELGGGAALTLSHDLDLVLWLTKSPVKRYFALANRKSSLQVSAEAGSDFLLELDNGCTGHVHLNYFQRPSERFTELIFEDATVVFNYYHNQLTIKRKGLSPIENGEYIEAHNFDRNQMFMDQLEDFFRKLSQFHPAEVKEEIENAYRLVEMCQFK